MKRGKTDLVFWEMQANITGKARKPRGKKAKAKPIDPEKEKQKRDKRKRRNERLAAKKDAHRAQMASAHAAGEKHFKPCHICRGEHWDKDCPRYGAWKSKMDANRLKKSNTDGDTVVVDN